MRRLGPHSRQRHHHDGYQGRHVTRHHRRLLQGWTVTVGDTSTIVSAYNPAIKTLSLATALAGAHWWNPYVLSPPRGGRTFSYSAVTKSWGTGAGSEPANRLSPAMAYSTRDAALVMFGDRA